MTEITKLGPKLADGRTAEVFAWGEGQALKLYREGWPLHVAEHEHRQVKASQNTGYRVPQVGEIVEIDGRVGIIYQRVEGDTMLNTLLSQPMRLIFFSRQLADLHLEMHAKVAAGLRPSKDRLAEKIEGASVLDAKLKAVALSRLAALPEETRLLHNDFHPDNIMLTSDGPVIIDWIDAACGHPLADVARTMIMMMVAIPKEERAGRLMSGIMGQIYLGRYLKRSAYSQQDLDAWMLPVAAARLEENISHEVKPLLDYVTQLVRNLR